MDVSITLPRLIGTRDAAKRLLEVQDVGPDLSGAIVRILARNLSTSTTSFTDELLQLLEARQAKSIQVLNAPTEFAEQVERQSKMHGYDNVEVAKAA